jgi:hypothetical protein
MTWEIQTVSKKCIHNLIEVTYGHNHKVELKYNVLFIV